MTQQGSTNEADLDRERIEIDAEAHDDASRNEDAVRQRDRLADQLAEQLAEREAELHEHRGKLEKLERRSAIDRAVASSGAIDGESLAMLVEARMEANASIGAERVIAVLRRERPALFRASGARASAVSPMHPSQGSHGGARLDRARSEARSTGDRRALMRYLRLRRGG
ncbi:MAG: hypothetical protein AAFX79_09055 [Planctomycetota bacterium]